MIFCELTQCELVENDVMRNRLPPLSGTGIDFAGVENCYFALF
jgi:hypothetical protein